MRFTKKMKKALSVVLTGALVVAGVNFGMTKAVAEEKYVDSTFKVCGDAVSDFAGDGDYTVNVAENSGSTWTTDGIINLAFISADREYTLSNIVLNVNGTYEFEVGDKQAVFSEDDGVYKVDLANQWSGDYSKGDVVYTSKDETAKLVFASPIELHVSDAKTSVTSYSIKFTYQLTGSTEEDPEVVLPESGIYLDWVGTWQKEGTENATSSSSKAENAKVIFAVEGYYITISKLDVSCMTKPVIEVNYIANGDKPQIMDSSWSDLSITAGTDSVKYDLSSYAADTLRLSSQKNTLVITGFSIYDDTVDYAKVKIASNISAAKALTEADYTSGTWNTLLDALAMAEGLAADASLDDINAANKSLKDAIAGLELADGTATPAPGETATPAPGETATPAPGETATPAPGDNATPAPGDNATPAPGDNATPAPGDNATPAPGDNATPAPGDNATPAPGDNATPAPGGNATPAPGGNATPAPGGNATPAPGGNNTTTTVGLAKNAKTTVGNFTYKVTKTSVKSAGKTTNGTVSVVAMSKKGKKAKKLSVPATVKASGATYTVTAVGAKAMKGAKATSVTLGKNVKSIGKSAFASCKKLSKLSIKAKLSSVAKGAFKGCKKNIKVSGASKKQNVKLLKKSGYKKFK